MKISKVKYNTLIKNIGVCIYNARQNAARAVNAELVKANWEIGRHVVKFEQLGEERAEYGSALLTSLSKDLQKIHGKGFGRRNLLDMRRFYLAYPKWQTVSAKFSWSHYVSLIGVSNDIGRRFYEKQCLLESWSSRELERQINSSLFERLALSKNKKQIIQLSKKGNIIKKSEHLIRDPYVLDFMQIPITHKLTEKGLEQKLITNLQLFLLELGKGFAFISRQHRISIRNNHFYIDLVFYHRILKCFVLIDLKTRHVKHGDIGQMNLYLNYFKKEENVPGDGEPIGIILSAEKDEVLVEYATGGLSNKIFVSKYQLYLPDQKLLERKVREILNSN
ncbi:MAG: DUF1016 family protein [Bacteroidia bacterium]|nr:DUF1016 family protein [Bacteroidia bacterium]